MPEDFGHIAATATENIQIARMGIAFETFLNLKRQSLQVGMACRNPDPDANRRTKTLSKLLTLSQRASAESQRIFEL